MSDTISPNQKCVMLNEISEGSTLKANETPLSSMSTHNNDRKGMSANDSQIDIYEYLQG